MSPEPGLLHGRLGLAASRIPHADRHGLLWLEYGKLSVEDGTLRFLAAKSESLDAGDYAIPYQAVSMILLGPGTSLTQDVLRLCARHGVLLAAVGEGGVKSYTAPPMGQGHSDIARRHAEYWAVPSAVWIPRGVCTPGASAVYCHTAISKPCAASRVRG